MDASSHGHRAGAEPHRAGAPSASRVRTTRLAPSPTGALHLGNARTFLITWALARQRGWRIVMRIEDLDGPRVKPGAADAALDTLAWLGIDWDEGPIIQSHDLEPHASAMSQLAALGLAYPSALTRSQIDAAASAPHAGDAAREGRVGSELRPSLGPRAFDDRLTNWRFVTPDREVAFDDEAAGPQRHRPFDTVGDFVVWTARAQPAYQLACVVDDARQGVTDVVRGEDLLDSAARQVLLIDALGLGPAPAYTHLPLVVGADGRRLAKRHGDTRVSRYREAGAPPERLIGLLARWSGVETDRRRGLSAAEFASGFNLARLARSPIVFGAEDDAWLLSRS